MQRELQAVSPVNLLLSGQLLEEMSATQPETLQALKAAVAAQRVGFVGGEYRELRLPLLVLRVDSGGTAGRPANVRIATRSPSGRLRASPVRHDARIAAAPRAAGIPRCLPRHAGRRAVSAWNAEQDPLGRRRRRHGRCVGQTAAGRQQAGNVSCARHEAGRIDGYGPRRDALLRPLGRGGQPLVRRPPPLCRLLFRPGTLPHRRGLLSQHHVPNHVDRFDPDQYRSPYLRQAVEAQQADPISSVGKILAASHGGRSRRRRWRRSWLRSGNARRVSWRKERERAVSRRMSTRRVPSAATGGRHGTPRPAVCRGPAAGGTASGGCLVINTHSFARRIGLELPQLSSPPSVGRPIYAADEADGRTARGRRCAGHGIPLGVPGQISALARQRARAGRVAASKKRA